MDIEQLITIVRDDYLADPESEELWTEEFMFRSFTEAERQACNRQFFIFDDSIAQYTKFDLVDGVKTYAIDPKINKIEYVGLAGVEVIRQSKHEIQLSKPAWRTETGVVDKPVNYIMRGHNMTFIPQPLASKDAKYIQSTAPATAAIDETWWDDVNSLLYKYNGTAWVLSPNASLGQISLEIYRLPENIVSDTSYIPEIPEEYHRDLIYWVLHEAYKRQDSDAYNQEKVDYFLGRFTQVFGEYISAEIRLNQMQQRGSMHLRPTQYTTNLTRSSNNDDWDGLG